MKTIYVDEVGYSSIAGPVLSCAVALEDGSSPFEVKDSKKLTKKKREELYKDLVNIPHAFGTASPKKIEKLNIHWARYESMRIAVEKLLKIENASKVIVDGKFIIPDLDIEQKAVIKADDKFWQCSCASILAKVKRDRVMAKLTRIEKYSYYKWESNAGYYTKDHRYGIIKYGSNSLHRQNFMFFQYALACHKKYMEFVNKGKTFEDYISYEKELVKSTGISNYSIWKNSLSDVWKEVPYGSL